VHSTLDDVAALAGFTKGAVYYYFKDKESLLLEVLQRIEMRSIDTTIANVQERGGSATERLEGFVKYQTRWAAQHPRDLAVLMLVSAETAHTSQRVRAQVVTTYSKLSAFLEELIEDGKRSGEFSRKQETRDTVLYLQAVHDGNMMIWYRSGIDPEIGRRLAKATLSGFLKTVKD
jgi:AcrR family transcriptional regulator